MPPPLRLLNGSRLARSTHGGAGTRRSTAGRWHDPSSSSSRRSFTASSTCRSQPSSDFTTVSADEISHFDALASSWWDPHGPSRILHLMNPLRHDFIRSCRASVATDSSASSRPQLRYLDVGCGGGIFAESAARLRDTHSVRGIDPSAGVIGVARSHARRDPSLRGGKLTYSQTSIEALTATATYDVVTVFEVVEHVAAPGAFLARCAPLVRPGGWLVLSTIARTWASWLTTNLVAEDLLRLVPRGTHDWRKYLNPAELRDYFLQRDAPPAPGYWTDPRCMGVVYVPGLGWKVVPGSEHLGNYFFAVRRAVDS
ncbi:S-adenosyl-L-methionine-dependent methyltransferase [Biscogniauxia sp. FL1348]|nr:S-adenosyl-L-methionine-dependent methyltransferase [Biscogniauxia sp. FL1348]